MVEIQAKSCAAPAGPSIGSTQGIREMDPEKIPVVSKIESKAFEILTLVLALAGILLRIERFALGRSFRGDEAAMALAIGNHALSELITKPLGGSVTAPLGFLVMEKLIVQLLGYQDFIFRLLPLLAGCLSVILMYLLAKELTGERGVAFSVGAFSINWMLIFYSSDLKQYSGDVAIALFIYLIAARYIKANTGTNAFLLAVVGLIGILCSHPAIFLLSCLGPVLLFQHWGERQELRQIFAIAGSWVGAFLVLYFLSYRFVGQNPYNVGYWNDMNALMPIPPWKDPGWFIIRMSSFFTAVLSLSPWLALDVILYGLGIVSLFSRGKWQWSFLLFGSMLVTLLASGIANYPFKGRLILFLVPSTLLAIGEGIEGLALWLKSPAVLARGLQWLLAAYLLWMPAGVTYFNVLQPRSFPYKEDIKPVLSFVQQHREPDDLIVVYDQAAATYEYYAPFYGLDQAETFVLDNYRKQPQKYRNAIDDLPKQRRIWIIFSNVLDTQGGVDVRTFLLDYISTIGGQTLEQYSATDDISSAHLVILR